MEMWQIRDSVELIQGQKRDTTTGKESRPAISYGRAGMSQHRSPHGRRAPDYVTF